MNGLVFFFHVKAVVVVPHPVLTVTSLSPPPYCRLVSRLFVCHTGNNSDVSLAFEDAKVIPSFSWEETDDTDNSNDIDDTNDPDDPDDINDTDDTDNKK